MLPMTAVSHVQSILVTLPSSRPAHLAEIPTGLGYTCGPMLAGPGLAWVYPLLAHAALESRGTVTEIGGATVDAAASILAQGRDFCAWTERQIIKLSGVEGSAQGPQILSRGPWRP